MNLWLIGSKIGINHKKKMSLAAFPCFSNDVTFLIILQFKTSKVYFAGAAGISFPES